MSNITFEPLVLHRGAADWGLPMTHIITRQGDDPYNRAVTIAEIPSIQPYCMGATPAEIEYADTQLAYATLFTAAPELLEALEDITKAYRAYRKAEGDDETSDSIELAEAAIAKAYGNAVPAHDYVPEYGWVFLGPDGEWHWAQNYDNHESVTEQRPATPVESALAHNYASVASRNWERWALYHRSREETLMGLLIKYQHFAGETAGACLGLAMSSDHPEPDTVLMDIFEKSQALASEARITMKALTKESGE